MAIVVEILVEKNTSFRQDQYLRWPEVGHPQPILGELIKVHFVNKSLGR